MVAVDAVYVAVPSSLYRSVSDRQPRLRDSRSSSFLLRLIPQR